MSDDVQTVRQQRREARIQRRDELAALGRLMAEPAGRRWLYNLLGFCHVYSTSFRTNALSMAHDEGQRSVGLKILADAEEAAQDMFFQMFKDVANERHRQSFSDTGTEPESDSE